MAQWWESSPPRVTKTQTLDPENSDPSKLKRKLNSPPSMFLRKGARHLSSPVYRFRVDQRVKIKNPANPDPENLKPFESKRK